MYHFLNSKLFIFPRKFGRILGINKFIDSLLEVGGYQERFNKKIINLLKKNHIFWNEPHPILSANLKSLNFENFKVINTALSDTVGKVEFIYGSDPQQTTGRVGVKNATSSYKNLMKVVDIQYALKTLNLKNPHVIKIDVEGHEYEVLSSILSNIKKLINLCVIFVEIHMTILDKRVLIIEMNKLIEKFQIKQNFKLV